MYGLGLPNDPRGSWSGFVGAWELFRFGRATKVQTRRSVAHRPHDAARRLAAKAALKYPPVRLTGLQARAVARGFAAGARKLGLAVPACSILPEHVHLVVARHRLPVERVVNLLKGAAARRLTDEGIHPLRAFSTPAGRAPKVWARGLWKVYLDSGADVRRAIEYVAGNPAREGLPPQRWSFVRPWP